VYVCHTVFWQLLPAHWLWLSERAAYVGILQCLLEIWADQSMKGCISSLYVTLVKKMAVPVVVLDFQLSL
jgi:hypothetical protein